MPTIAKTTETSLRLAAEDQLLVVCSQTALDASARAAARALLARELDWEYIVETAIRHNVAPLFYHGLSQATAGNERATRVPTARRVELQRLHDGNRARNQRLYRVIREIAEAFARAGIQAMGLKDVQLAREVYPDLALRPMGDIDLLIHREDYGLAREVLGSLGFAPLPHPDIPFTLKYAWAHHFRRDRDNVWIDLQWNVVQREWDAYGEGNFDYEIERLWRGTRPMSFDGATLLAPRPEDMLLHLCQHLEGHAYAELVLFCDIAELLRHAERGERLDWAYVAELARKYRAEATVYYVLYLVERLFGIPRPAQLMEGRGHLAPTFLQAGLFAPLYGNLTTLHDSLDQIRLAAAPSERTLRRLTGIVRRQAHGAMQAYRALDDLALPFLQAGGTSIIFDGRSSERVLPASALRPFERIDGLILDRDLDRLRQTLRSRGLTAQSDHGAERYVRRWEAASADPALDGPTEMALEVTVETNVAELVGQEAPESSMKARAANALWGTMTGRGGDARHITVPLRVAALAPEELVLVLCHRLGRQKQNRLFNLCLPLELLRTYAGPLDWDRVLEMAAHYGVRDPVCQGAAVLGAFTGDPRIARGAPVDCPSEPPRVLEAARYDAAVWGRYAAFRRPFHYVLSLVSTPGLGDKVRHLRRAPVLLELVPGILARRHRSRAARDFAYWIE